MRSKNQAGRRTAALAVALALPAGVAAAACSLTQACKADVECPTGTPRCNYGLCEAQ